MARKNRILEEQVRRAKIRGLLQEGNISSMEDISNLFKETIAKFMESGFDEELDDELVTASTIIETRTLIIVETDTATKHCVPASGM